ncbi:hypothetical protein A2U01_0091423, partial [Trifolium medium]|nr:hypothetical protein [Trifolium medium]
RTRRLGCLCTLALRVAPMQAARCAGDRNQIPSHNMNCALRHCKLRVAPVPEDEEFVAA